MLLNASGYWLLAPNPKDEWGFMFKNQRRFSDRYPGVWKTIVEGKKGQVHTEDGIFTYATIYPLDRHHVSSDGSVEADGSSSANLDDKTYFWVLLTHVPQAYLNTQLEKHIKQGLLQFAIVSFFIIALAWFLSRERVKRKWAINELQKKEQYLQTVTSQLGEGLIVIDCGGEVLTINAKGQQLTGWSSAELVGLNLNKILPRFSMDHHRDNRDCVVLRAIEDRIAQRVDNVPFLRKDSASFPVSFSAAPFLHENQVQGAIITFRDISERLRLQAELKKMAIIDPLTGINNRGEIERLLSVEIERAGRYRRPLAVLMVDIDHFKSINDTYGHPIGDIVLKAACKQMALDLRSSDFLGRYGGEEFLIVLPETNLSVTQSIAERLRHQLSKLTIPVNQKDAISFTVSIGAAGYPESAASSEKLIQIADGLLYRAKNEGRNRVVVTNETSPDEPALVAGEI
jgi:diguanylate cyclase (GGDEF)-like protein/PAS domain S-box-containing protein